MNFVDLKYLTNFKRFCTRLCKFGNLITNPNIFYIQNWVEKLNNDAFCTCKNIVIRQQQWTKAEEQRIAMLGCTNKLHCSVTFKPILSC